jgi:putative oxidoreductase
MKAFLSNSYVVLVSRFVLGFVFLFASIEKISNPEAFASAVELYKLLPVASVNLFAVIVPWVELVCGFSLIAGVCVRGSSFLLTSLTALFIGAIIMAVLRHLTIDCGCFGSPHADPVGWMKVTEDFGLLLLGMHIFLFGGSMPAVDNFYIPKARV